MLCYTKYLKFNGKKDMISIHDTKSHYKTTAKIQSVDCCSSSKSQHSNVFIMEPKLSPNKFTTAPSSCCNRIKQTCSLTNKFHCFQLILLKY